MVDALAKGWFSELSPLWPGQCMSLEYESILFEKKSEYQDIKVLQSKNYGKVLVLDGVIQVTERDEFSYQEMMAHVPLFAHPNPKRVCIIGGGDGGVLSEVCKHPSVEKVVLCEIDQVVIDSSKEYFPKFRRGFADPRLELFTGDGAQFLADHPDSFDVIITDSSDPIGPAAVLFQEAYYVTMKKALRPNGIICSQAECQWLHLDIIKNMISFCNSHFKQVEYAYVCIPTYPSGQIGLLLTSLGDTPLQAPRSTPAEVFTPEDAESLLYYSPQIHSASFVLPPFARRVLSAPVSESSSASEEKL